MPMFIPFHRTRHAAREQQNDPSGGGTGGTGGGKPTPPAPSPEPQTFSAEYVRELRAENKAWREKHAQAVKAAEEAQAAAEKAAKEAADKVAAAEKAASDRLLQSELKAHALKAGLVDLDGLKLADLSKVKLNDKGEVEGAEDLFKALKEAKPYLFGQTNTSTPGATPPKNPPTPARVTEITDPGQYAAAKAQFLASHK